MIRGRMRKDFHPFSSQGRLVITVLDEQADFDDQKSVPPSKQSHDSPGSEKTRPESFLEINDGVLPKPVLLERQTAIIRGRTRKDDYPCSRNSRLITFLKNRLRLSETLSALATVS